jgi:hypothetical protein
VAFGICSRFVFMFAGKIRVNRPKSRLRIFFFNDYVAKCWLSH